jgi:hypothetical protein
MPDAVPTFDVTLPTPPANLAGPAVPPGAGTCPACEHAIRREQNGPRVGELVLCHHCAHLFLKVGPHQYRNLTREEKQKCWRHPARDKGRRNQQKIVEHAKLVG